MTYNPKPTTINPKTPKPANGNTGYSLGGG